MANSLLQTQLCVCVCVSMQYECLRQRGVFFQNTSISNWNDCGQVWGGNCKNSKEKNEGRKGNKKQARKQNE